MKCRSVITILLIRHGETSTFVHSVNPTILNLKTHPFALTRIVFVSNTGRGVTCLASTEDAAATNTIVNKIARNQGQTRLPFGVGLGKPPLKCSVGSKLPLYNSGNIVSSFHCHDENKRSEKRQSTAIKRIHAPTTTQNSVFSSSGRPSGIETSGLYDIRILRVILDTSIQNVLCVLFSVNPHTYFALG